MGRKSVAKITNYWLKQYILLGYAAKGAIYLLIGIFAVRAALLYEREAKGTYFSLLSLARQPLGRLFVLLLAIALMGYVLRRAFQVLHSFKQSDVFAWQRLFKQIGYIMSGLSYTGVAYSALQIAIGTAEYDDTAEDLADELLEFPIGEWSILLGGMAVFTVGVLYIYGAYTGSYISEFDSSDIHHRVEKWTRRIGKLGVAARGFSFVLTGIYIISAAMIGNAELAGGLQNVLDSLTVNSFGRVWLSLIGVGFIAYGLYMFVAARYRRYTIR